MPKQKRTQFSEPSGGQAQYVLRRLLRDRHVSVSDIRGYVNEMQSEIAALEEQLQALRSAAGESDSAPVRRGPGRPPRATTEAASAGTGVRKRRKQNLTPERRAALRLQGHYLALIRQIPASRRGQYKKIVQDKGAEAAIRALRATLKK